MASAAVMGITKRSISGSEKSVLAKDQQLKKIEMRAAIVFDYTSSEGPRPAAEVQSHGPGLGTTGCDGVQRFIMPRSYPKAACRRCLSAWRLRRESHSRTPYPRPNPTIRTIAVSSIETPLN
jgi:hypothetical protein